MKRPQPQPPHTRGTFHRGCSHFTRKIARFRAPASLQHKPHETFMQVISFVMYCLCSVKFHTTLHQGQFFCDVLLCSMKSHTTLHQGQFFSDVLLCSVKSHTTLQQGQFFSDVLFPTSLCGVLVFGSALPPPGPPPPPASASASSSSSTTCRTQLTHTQLVHTQLAHATCPHNSSTHNFSTQLLHPPTTCPHNLHTHTQLLHTQLAHTPLAHTQLVHTQLCVAGATLGDMYVHSAWQAWHLWHWAGSGGALGSELARGRRRCLRGRCGTWRHRTSLCVAGVALGDMYVHSAWQAWHLWHWACSGGGLGSQLAPWMPPLRGTRRYRPSLCVAGVALGDIERRFAWQAWHLWHWAGSGGALGSQLAPWTPPLFAWQAWYLAISTVTLRGRRGTWRH